MAVVRRSGWMLVLMLLALALSGCVEEPGSVGEVVEDCDETLCPASDLLTDDGRDLATDLQANDSVPAPTWAVGQHFGQHIFDGDGDSAGYHIDSVVAEETGNAWVIAPNDEELARRHAYWDYPFLGTFDKDTLATSAYGLDWDFMFDFPLTDGKTWTREVVLPHSSNFWSNTYEVEFVTTYASVVPTFEGDYPGFHIVGETGGETLFSYYYVPHIGWYDQFYWYDIETDAPDDYRLKAISMGTGDDWTGTYYVADVVAEHSFTQFFCPILTESWCQPTNPYGQFTLQEGNHLIGNVVTGAWGGHARTLVQPPEGNARTYEHTNDEVPDMESGEPADFDAVTHIAWYDEAAIPGDWTVTGSGAGFFWGVFVALKELDLQEGTL